jgi:hypothetical protein
LEEALSDVPEIDPLFGSQKLNELGVWRVNFIKAAFDELLGKVCASCPNSRELALAKTKLEEACFYAVKASANDPLYQEKP